MLIRALLIEGLRNPTAAHDDCIRELVPFSLTSFDDATRAALGAARSLTLCRRAVCAQSSAPAGSDGRLRRSGRDEAGEDPVV